MMTQVSTSGDGCFDVSFSDGNCDNAEDKWIPGAWYEFWITVDISSGTYQVAIKGGDGQFTQQHIITIRDSETNLLISNFYFRSPVGVLRSVMLGQANGKGVENPFDHHRWFFNYIAVDPTEKNLTTPPNALPLPPAIPPAIELRWGFAAVADTEYRATAANFLGTFDGTYVAESEVPWIYQWGLNTWTYSLVFAREATEENPSPVHSMASDAPALAPGSWNYVTNSGAAPITDGNNVNSVGFLGWIYVGAAPWVYSYDQGTWVYLVDGDWNSEVGLWTYVYNSRQ